MIMSYTWSGCKQEKERIYVSLALRNTGHTHTHMLYPHSCYSHVYSQLHLSHVCARSGDIFSRAVYHSHCQNDHVRIAVCESVYICVYPAQCVDARNSFSRTKWYMSMFLV